MLPATPIPPLILKAPVVVLVALLVFNTVTIAFAFILIEVPLSALKLSSAMFPTFVKLLSLKFVEPKLAEPVAVILFVPISMLPNPLEILPEASCPTPVISPWCCVTLLDCILASGTVPVVNCVADKSVSPLPLPLNVLVPILTLPNPEVIEPAFNAPVPVISVWCCVIALDGTLASGIVPLVKSLALASPIKLSALISLATCKPPVIFTAAAPPANVPVAFVASVNVTKLFALNVVKPPAAGVVCPIGTPLIAPIIKSPVIVRSWSIVTLCLNVLKPVVSPITIAVAACPKAIAVVLSFSKLNVPVSSVSIVFPLTAKLPATTTFALFKFIVPVLAPILMVVAAPNAFTVVAPVFARLNVPPLTVRSLSPPMLRLPKTSRALLTVVVPDVAPKLNPVAAPNALTVVAFVLNAAKVVLDVVTLFVKFGLLLKTKLPVPVSSLITPASWALVVDANCCKPVPVTASVPLVGNVTFVLFVVVSVNVCAPLCVKFPPNVIVLLPLFTPVPPYVGLMIVPFQTPVVIVPSVSKLEFTIAPPSVVLFKTLASLM